MSTPETKEPTLEKVFPGISCWSIYHPDRDLHLNGWYLSNEEEIVVIDPPSPGVVVLEQIAQKGAPVAVLLTSKHHTRAAEIFRREFGSMIWVPEKDLRLMEIPADRTFEDNDFVPGNLRVVSVSGNRTEGESAFLLAGAVPTLIVGNAVVGHPTGQLSFHPDLGEVDREFTQAGLSRLLKHEFEALLLSDGDSIVRGGFQALRSFLSATGVGHS